MKVLVVEDEKKVLSFLQKGLSSSEISVDTASNLDELFAALMSVTYDAIVLDRLLGGVDAMTAISRIRTRAPSTKILILSALSDVDDKVEGLSSGADDYLGKPFEISELIARLRAICRRTAAGEGKDNVLRYKDLTIYLDTQRVERNGTRIQLTAKEYKLLVFLIKKPNRIFSKVELLSNIWEIQYYPESNVIEVLVNHLRNKVDKDFEPKLIHSRRGIGYWGGDANV